MKLLFDQNLSPHLVDSLTDIYPNSSHVALLGLDRASDEQIWKYARDHSYIIVTKDADLNELSLLRGFPPKVIWLRLGNCATRRIESVLRAHENALIGLNEDASTGILTLF